LFIDCRIMPTVVICLKIRIFAVAKTP